MFFFGSFGFCILGLCDPKANEVDERLLLFEWILEYAQLVELCYTESLKSLTAAEVGRLSIQVLCTSDSKQSGTEPSSVEMG